MLKKIWRGIGRFLADCLFPVRCLGCGADYEHLCQKCLAAIRCCTGEQKSEGEIDNLFAAARFDDVSVYIHAFKYGGVVELAEPLAALMATALTKARLDGDFTLVPVPLHRKGMLWRGFNQSALLAEAVGRRLSMKPEEALKRIKNTQPQAEMDRQARLKNMVEAFEASRNAAGRDFIVVDDVYTTGATMNECAKALKLAGARRVFGLVLARA